MVYLTEDAVRARSPTQDPTAASVFLAIDAFRTVSASTFDIFLSHAVADAVLVLGVKRTLEATGLTVYVDWMTDPSLDRAQIDAKTAVTLRMRMRQSASLMYLYSRHSQQSRWMPWELGYFEMWRYCQ